MKLLLLLLLPLCILQAEIRKEFYDSGELKTLSNYKNNQKHGVEKSFDKNGNLTFKSSYKNGLKHG